MIALILEIVSLIIIAICIIGTIVLGISSLLSINWWLAGDIILYKKRVRRQRK